MHVSSSSPLQARQKEAWLGGLFLWHVTRVLDKMELKKTSRTKNLNKKQKRKPQQTKVIIRPSQEVNKSLPQVIRQI